MFWKCSSSSRLFVVLMQPSAFQTFTARLRQSFEGRPACLPAAHHSVVQIVQACVHSDDLFCTTFARALLRARIDLQSFSTSFFLSFIVTLHTHFNPASQSMSKASINQSIHQPTARQHSLEST
mmetsp:Transcript_23900/g.40357  ORF Transcript_23900/g.40357 Transcript_23900/m.40357 type:complete len:124 (-) Transcript_23900:87-458(-)